MNLLFKIVFYFCPRNFYFVELHLFLAQLKTIELNLLIKNKIER